MRETTDNPEPVVDIWPYVRVLPSEHIHSCSFAHELIEHVYRSGEDRYDHVLVTQGQPLYLVVVVDRLAAEVLGHHVLDIASEYGLTPSPHQG